MSTSSVGVMTAVLIHQDRMALQRELKLANQEIIRLREENAVLYSRLADQHRINRAVSNANEAMSTIFRETVLRPKGYMR